MVFSKAEVGKKSRGKKEDVGVHFLAWGRQKRVGGNREKLNR
jgi:hypothetical protein